MNPRRGRRRPIPGGLAVDPRPREVRRRRRRLEEGARPTHKRLIAPARRKYQTPKKLHRFILKFKLRLH